jgi:hypothetical protein
MDVRTVFFNGELNEEIYMDQPLRFETKGQERKVCKLKRSIYGLKQVNNGTSSFIKLSLRMVLQ